TAIREGRVRADDVAVATDDGLIHELDRDDPTGLARRLRERRLAKRALDLPATDLPADVADWPATDPDLTEQVEDRLAEEAGLPPGTLFLDFPAKERMLGVELPLVRRDAAAGGGQSTGDGVEIHLGLPRVAAELYRSARRLRVFTLQTVRLRESDIVELIRLPREEVAARLAAQRGLLSASAGPRSPGSSRRPRDTPPNRSGPESR
ncbi:MAG TPA: hypothetical protein VIV10_09410, partial [Gemmatimonadales bacterium]